MEEFFQTVLQISLSTAAVIGILLLLVPMLQTWYSASWRKVIWFVIAVRLLVPFSYPLPLAPVQMDTELDTKSLIGQSIEQNNDPIENQELLHQAAIEPYMDRAQVANQKFITTKQTILSDTTKKQGLSREMRWFVIWLFGTSLFLVWHGSQYLHFHRKILHVTHPLPGHEMLLQQISQNTNSRYLPKVLISSKVQGPMLVGLFRPVILIPNRIYGGQELSLILRHELIHHQQKDLWYKLVLLLANAVHWFNPLVYLMIRQAGRDLEQVCDEQVVKGQDLNYRKAYSMTILKAMSSSRGFLLSTYLSKQAQNSKKRFTAILQPKQYRKGIIALIVVMGLAVTASGCLQIGHLDAYEKLVQQVETCIPEGIHLEDADYTEHPVYFGNKLTVHIWEVILYNRHTSSNFSVKALSDAQGNMMKLTVDLGEKVRRKNMELKNISPEKAEKLAAQYLETLSGEKHLHLEPSKAEFVKLTPLPCKSLGWIAKSHKANYYYKIEYDLEYSYVTYYEKYYDDPQLKQQVEDWLQTEAARIYEPYHHIIGSTADLFYSYRDGNQYIANLYQELYYERQDNQENVSYIWETGERNDPWKVMKSELEQERLMSDNDRLIYDVQIKTEIEQDGTLNLEQCKLSIRDCDAEGNWIWTPLQDLSVIIGKSQNAMAGMTQDKMQVYSAAADFVLAYLNKDREYIDGYVDEERLPFPNYEYQPYHFQQINFDLNDALYKQYGQFGNDFDKQTQITLKVELRTSENTTDYLAMEIEKVDNCWQVTDAVLEK